MRPSQRGLPFFSLQSSDPTPMPGDHFMSLTACKETHTELQQKLACSSREWNDISPSWSPQVSEKALRRMTKCPVTTNYHPPKKTKGHTVSISQSHTTKLCSSCIIPTAFVCLKCLCCDSLHYRHPGSKEEMVLVIFINRKGASGSYWHSYCLFRKLCPAWKNPK